MLVLVISGIGMLRKPWTRKNGKVVLTAGLLLIPGVVAVFQIFGSMGAPDYCS